MPASSKAPRAWVRESDYSKKQNRPSGEKLWEVAYVDPKSKKRRTRGGFKTKAAAQEWADHFMANARRGEWIDPSRGEVTFGALAEPWFAAQHFDRKGTEGGYRQMVRGNNAMTRTFNDVAIIDITAADVSTFTKEAVQSVSAQRVRHMFYTLRLVLDFAVDNDRLLLNPARRVNVRRLPKPTTVRAQERKRVRLSIADVDALVAAMPEPYNVLTRVLADAGMRPEEALGLRLCDVDSHEYLVYVNGVVVEVAGNVYRENAAKTPGSMEPIELNPDAGEALNAYIKAHRRRAALWFAEHPEHDHPGEELPLFVGTVPGRLNGADPLDRLDYSKPMRYSTFYKRYWRKATRAAGLPDSVRVYDLRHFHASACLDNGMSIKDVQTRLRHASAAMTVDRYWLSRTDDEARKLRRDQVAAALGRSPRPDNVTDLNTKRA